MLFNVCLFMHDPRETQLTLIKRILHYVRGTLDAGLHFGTSGRPFITAYSDSCLDSRRSTSGYCIFLGDNLASLSSKRQTSVFYSSACPVLVQRQSIRLLRQLLSVAGYISCFRSFMSRFLWRLLSIATILVQST
jgi:hypothetical protein